MEGKEIIGVVRKVVFKDKNGEKIPFPTVDVEKCYLYVQYLDDYKDFNSELQMIVIEGLYYSVGSVLKLKYVEGKWHLLDELKKIDPINILTSQYHYFCFSDKSGYSLNEVAKEAYYHSHYSSKVETQFFKELKMINQQFGGVIDFRVVCDIEKHFDLMADNQSVDFDQYEFVKLITGINKYLADDRLYMPRALYLVLNDISKALKNEEMSLKEWISYVAFVFEYLNCMDFLSHCKARDFTGNFINLYESCYSEYVGDAQKNMLEIISKLFRAKVESANTPIYTQMREELEAKKDIYERKLKK